jgi:opacity protein-like surface antigen
MKRIALLGLLSVAVMANESGFYMGVEVGGTRMDATTDYTPADHAEFKHTNMSWALDAGYYINQNNRAYVYYQNIDKDDTDFGAKTDIYGVGYDYLFGTSELKPFIGAVVAYSSYEINGFKLHGMAYGAQIGIDYSINNNLSVDAGFRYLDSTAETTQAGDTSKMGSFQTLFFGANYKF